MSLPPCSHRPPCPGCPRYGEPGIGARAASRLSALAERHDARLAPVEESRDTRYRHRARLMVRGRAAAPKIGLFQAGSHRIVDTPDCQIHHEGINAAARALKDEMRAVGAAPYADAPHRGLVRALQAVVERESQRVQLTLVTRGTQADDAAPLLDALAARLGDTLQGLWWNGNPERTNVILGPHWQHWSGETATRESIGGAAVYFPPGAFGQSHLGLADRLVAAVHEAVPERARVAEFHAGCGAIGLGLAQRGARVAFNEIHPHGLDGLARGIAALPEEAAQRTSTHPGEAGAHTALLAQAEVAIVDPPRTGLDARLREAIASAPPPRLVYVSCDLDSLERDTEALTAGGRLRLTELTPFALFPFTEHVETLARFDRA